MRLPNLLSLCLLLPGIALAVDADGDSYDAPIDCDDSNALINPGAAEVPGNGADDNCDGAELCYQDADRDHYGRNLIALSADLTCTAPGLAASASDCNDNNASVNPGATEIAADGVDSDCTGTELCFADQDGDQYGGTATTQSADFSCTSAGLSFRSSDCDDAAPAVFPGAPEICDNQVDDDCNGIVDDTAIAWFVDTDFDGWGDTNIPPLVSCGGAPLPPLPAGIYVQQGEDCDDANPVVHPTAVERCDTLDNDCNGLIDDDIPVASFFLDADLDGFGNPDPRFVIQVACPPSGFSPFNDDCNDADPTIHPLITVDRQTFPPLANAPLEASEADRDPAYVGDGIDQDCDGVDTCYADLDRDGFGAPLQPGQLPGLDNDLNCDNASVASTSTSSNNRDCDDGDPNSFPGAAEVVGDALDQDCDGVDTCYVDADGDGWGTSATLLDDDLFCDNATVASASHDGDCDDAVGAVNPGAAEVCDGIDNDCDGVIDEGSGPGTMAFFLDADGDGYGDASVSIQACGNPVGYTLDATDCDDADAEVNPGGFETCDGRDEDCDGIVDNDAVCDTGDTDLAPMPVSGGGCSGAGTAYTMGWLLVLPFAGLRRRRDVTSPPAP